jgi:organic hydroperoxide reductase OsmC/OhrA
LQSRHRMSIAPFPHRYVVTYDGGQLLAEPRPPIRAGAPPQFGGSHDVWSPEELLVGAAVLCLQTTFSSLARRAGVHTLAWKATATGILDKGPAGPVFTAIRIAVEITTDPGDEARVEALVHTAERHCIVSNALKAPTEVTVAVQSERTLPAVG